jgi:hypothetical protein
MPEKMESAVTGKVGRRDQKNLNVARDETSTDLNRRPDSMPPDTGIGHSQGASGPYHDHRDQRMTSHGISRASRAV